jgi:predicted metal-binding membrane protein
MADRSGPAVVTEPVQALPPRQVAVPWIALSALAAGAWAVTIILARAMGNGPGTMGLALLPFLGLWVLMMAAMMLPSVAPVAVLWARLISGASAGFGRAARMSLFLGGYLLVWAAFGAVAFAALAGSGRLLTASPTAAKWLIAVGVMNVAVMAALALVIFAEKLWRYGKPFGRVVGVVLVTVGVLAIWFPWLLPGLYTAPMPAM